MSFDTLSEDLRAKVILAVTIIGVLTALSNGLVIAAVCRLRWKDRVNSTPNILIANQALTDLVVGIMYIPSVAMITRGLPRDKYACITLVSALIIPINTSVWGFLAITTEKFISVAFPYRSVTLLTERNVGLAGVLSWVMGFIYGTVPFFWNGWEDGDSCLYVNVMHEKYMSYIEFWLFLCIPLFFILCMYVYIFYVSLKHMRKMRSAAGSDVTAQEDMMLHGRKLKVAVKCFLMILLYVLMQGPPRIFLYLFQNYNVLSRGVNPIYQFMTLLLNSTINPLLYIYQSQTLKKEVTAMLCGCRKNVTVHPGSDRGNGAATGSKQKTGNKRNNKCTDDNRERNKTEAEGREATENRNATEMTTQNSVEMYDRKHVVQDGRDVTRKPRPPNIILNSLHDITGDSDRPASELADRKSIISASDGYPEVIRRNVDPEMTSDRSLSCPRIQSV